jgi:hypothetical protein
METWATAEGFFKCKVPREKMSIPELGDIWIHGLTSGQKDDYENNVVQVQGRSRQVKLTNARAVLMQMTVHDQHGNRMFAEKDIGRLCTVPAMVADPILDVARRLSGMATGEIEELVKNSQDPEDSKQDSGSGLQKRSVIPTGGSETR